MSSISMDVSSVEELSKKLTDSGKNAENVINKVLHDTGGPIIQNEINVLLPSSGRKWSGKKQAAKGAKPFLQDNGNLSVTVRTKSAYNYLYFPDDGTNTKHHVGYHGIPREFMRQGAENKSQEIIDICVGNLAQELEE